MWRNFFAIALILWFGTPEVSTHTAETLAAPMHVGALASYIPFIKVSPMVEAITTAQGEWIGYPTDYYLYGYVRNLTTKPLYSTIVDIEVTIWPYGDPPPPPYTEIVHVTPALTATLPGQVNPFSYNLLLGKASASVGPVKGASARPWMGGDIYYPLTITGTAYQDNIYSGTIQNDHYQPLHHLRVVAAEPSKCGWREAVIGDEILLPGQDTSFTISNYSSGCISDNLIVVGQGAIQP